MKKSSVTVHLVQAAILVGALALGFLLLGPIKRAADRRAEAIRAEILGRLEDRFDIEISYSSISPALLSAVNVRNLNLVFDSGSFQARSLRVHYNPLRQLFGGEMDVARLISRVVVSDGHLVLNIKDGPVETGLSPEVPVDYEGLLGVLADKTAVLNNISADIRMPGIESAEVLVGRMQLRTDGVAIAYEFDISSELDPVGLDNLGRVKGELGSRGRFSPAEGSANGRFEIRELSTDLLSLEPMTADLTFNDGVLIGRRIGDDKAVDISGEISQDGWKLSGETDQLRITELLRPGVNSYAFEPWMASELDGRFSLEGNTDSLEYSVDLDIQAPENLKPGGLSARILAQGNLEQADVETLEVRTEWGNCRFGGKILIREMAPLGTLALNLDQSLLGYPLRASFATTYNHGALEAVPLNVTAGDLTFSDFRFLLVREESLVSASLKAVPLVPGDPEPKSILVDAMLELGEERVLHGFVDLDGIQAALPARLAGMKNPESMPVLGDSRLTFRGFFEANDASWVVNVNEASLRNQKNPDNALELSGRIFPDRWAMDSLHIAWNDYEADGQFFAVRGADGGTAEGKILVGSEVFPLSGDWFADGRLEILLDDNLRLNIGAENPSGRSITLRSEGFSVPLKDAELVGNLDLRGRVATDFWEVFINRTEIRFIDSRQERILTAAGLISPGNVNLSQLSYQDDSGLLEGGGVLSSRDGGRFINGRFNLSSAEGESYQVTLVRENENWDLRTRIREARLRRISPERLGGTADLTASMTGTAENPLISGELTSRDGILDGSGFVANARMSLKDGKLRVNDVLFDHEGISLNRGLLLYDLEAGSLRTTADLDATFNQVPVSSGFSLAVDFDKPPELSSLMQFQTLPYTGTLATRPVLWNTREHLPSFTFQFIKNTDTLAIQTPDGKVLDLNYNFNSGALDITSSKPLPVSANGGGTIRDGRMDLSFPELEIDPQLINYVMVRDPILLEYHVVFQGGSFQGGLDIEGPVSDGDLYGTLRAVDLKVDTPYTYSDIQPASTEIHFDGNRISVDRIEIPVGDGFVFGEGYLVLDRWSINEFDMTYGARAGNRGNGVPIYYPLLGVILDGTFIGQMRMTGDGQQYYLDGEFTFPTLNASLGAAVIPVSQRKEGKYPKPVYLDMDFITGRNVTFFLPNEQLKIVRATAEPGQRLNLNYTSDPKTMSITGDLPIKSGNISYFDRDFQVTEGAMTFNESLGSFDPILDFRAETRVRDENNEEVTVALVYNAPVKSDFNPRVETIPARTEIEILELFGQAVVPYAEGGGNEGNAVLLATSSVFAQAGIVQPFEEVIREGLNLDMVTLRTDIIENTLTEGLGRGEDTDLTSLNSGLGRYLDNTSLFAGKYIGDALFISGSVSANYFEEQRNRSMFGGLEFSTSVSLEMETPFFNVAWSYSPDPAVDRHFVEDNEISLKWQFSF